MPRFNLPVLLETISSLLCARSICKRKFPEDLLSPHTNHPPEIHDRAIADQLAWHIEHIARRSPLRMTCLYKSVALANMLARRRIPCQLKIGVTSKTASPFEAHAWVVACGKNFNWGIQPSNEFGLNVRPNSN